MEKLQLAIKQIRIKQTSIVDENIFLGHFDHSFHLISASKFESQVSILLAIELIWNLCEVLFIDAASG